MKFYAEITESLTWSVVIDVPDNIAGCRVSVRDYVYENWGECDKDIRHDGECEIVTLEPYSEE